MSEGKLKVKSGGVLNSEVIFDARSDELLVLVAVMDAPYRYESAEEIAKITRLPVHRVAAAIALFTSAGLFIRENEISYEFDPKAASDDFTERPALEVAESIRKNDLAELFAELARIMNKDKLTNTEENKMIASLVEDLGLCSEYIAMLAAYMQSKRKTPLSVKKLRDKASSLVSREIDTTEKLENYIKKMENDYSLTWAFRHTFKIYNRAPSDYELELYRKWTELYGFASEIIRLAIDVNTRAKNNYSYPYLDTLLTGWHEKGCLTLEDCKKQADEDSGKLKEQFSAERTKKTVAPKPTYGDFDAKSALERAIAKSFTAFDDSEKN